MRKILSSPLDSENSRWASPRAHDFDYVFRELHQQVVPHHYKGDYTVLLNERSLLEATCLAELFRGLTLEKINEKVQALYRAPNFDPSREGFALKSDLVQTLILDQLNIPAIERENYRAAFFGICTHPLPIILDPTHARFFGGLADAHFFRYTLPKLPYRDEESDEMIYPQESRVIVAYKGSIMPHWIPSDIFSFPTNEDRPVSKGYLSSGYPLIDMPFSLFESQVAPRLLSESNPNTIIPFDPKLDSKKCKKLSKTHIVIKFSEAPKFSSGLELVKSMAGSDVAVQISQFGYSTSGKPVVIFTPEAHQRYVDRLFFNNPKNKHLFTGIQESLLASAGDFNTLLEKIKEYRHSPQTCRILDSPEFRALLIKSLSFLREAEGLLSGTIQLPPYPSRSSADPPAYAAYITPLKN